jgi:hypothetical protein
MSHLHNIGGNSNAAAEYQEYLARLGAARRARRGLELAQNPGLRTFDSAIDPDHDPERDRDGEEDGGEEEGETKPEGEPAEGGEADPTWRGQA